ncbi:hypothetical protein [Stakelama saccharophila]|uniref:Uncharacterized protein n=1 Tax=Stakelama saccharophila TaxID=3075605 RepID=A0ABZ0B7I5_9SPHN|nr:hypothetical protein [Stakelama sp. W311]WNO53223.1 hypothetical protein RPR59_12330 [Stakelama sp. W311]
MRALISKVVTGSMIAGAALMVSACGGTDETTDNTTITDLNSTDTMGTMDDNMSMVDGAMGNDAMMANDMMANDMMSNDIMGNDMMSNEM